MWAKAHAEVGISPRTSHESIVSVFCPHERTVRESSILRRYRILSNPSLFLGHSTSLIQASFSALPTLCRVLFNKRFCRKFCWLLLDSRVVDLSTAYHPTLVILSSLKPLFFNRLKNELRFLANGGA